MASGDALTTRPMTERATPSPKRHVKKPARAKLDARDDR